jgi:hypothetical protein
MQQPETETGGAHRARISGPFLSADRMMNDTLHPQAGPLLAAAGQLGLELGGEATRRLLAYLDLLQRWNATYNLTAVRDPAEMLTQHLADCWR